MYNIGVIGGQAYNIAQFKDVFPIGRWLQYHSAEEGVAAVSVYGRLFHVVFLDWQMSVLPAWDMHLILKQEFGSLPLLITKSPADIFACIAGSCGHQCMGSQLDFLRVAQIFGGIDR